MNSGKNSSWMSLFQSSTLNDGSSRLSSRTPIPSSLSAVRLSHAEDSL